MTHSSLSVIDLQSYSEAVQGSNNIPLILKSFAFYKIHILGINFDEGAGGPLYLILLLGTIIPGLAVAVRRLHDVGKSGWFIFIWIVPLVGPFWLLIILASEGSHGKNVYGENPKRPYSEINDIGLE